MRKKIFYCVYQSQLVPTLKTYKSIKFLCQYKVKNCFNFSISMLVLEISEVKYHFKLESINKIIIYMKL